MKTVPDNMSARESLEIITGMIEQAKGAMKRNSFHYLLWGWVIALANLGAFVLIQMRYPNPYFVWFITIPAFLTSMYYGYTHKKKDGMSTHFNRVTLWLWVSFAITILVFVIFANTIQYNLNPVIITLSAIPTLASGHILKYRPLILGGFCFWIFGVVDFLVSYEWQNLVGAAAVISGYLIPGYILKFKG